MRASERLRHELWDSGESWAMIARGCDSNKSSVCRFAHGKGGLSLRGLDELARYLGMVFVREDEWKRRERIWQAWRAGRLRMVEPLGANDSGVSRPTRKG